MPSKKSKNQPRPITKIEKLNKVSIGRLQTLMKVDEAGSLIAAAGGLQIRADQFSRQLRELEDGFEVELVRSEGRTVHLTPEGSALAGITRDFFRQLEDFRASQQGRKHTYVIGAGESLLHWIVIPAVAALEQSYPNVSFKLRNLQNSEIMLGLERRTIDFGLVRKESMREPLTCVGLGQVGYVLCVPKNLCVDNCLSRHDSPCPKLSESELLGLLQTLPLAVHLENTYVQSELEAALSARDIHPNIRLRFDSFPNAKAALSTGSFATLMIRFRGLQGMPEGVKILPLPFLDHTCRDIFLLWKERLFEVRPEAQKLKNELVHLLNWQDA